MPPPVSMLSFVTADDLARLDRLELVSQKLVNGYISGKHKSLVKGGCSEFSDHRAYSPGDEIRHLDWRVFAKSNRYYVKEYDEETAAHGMIVLDVSGSMNFGMETVSKLECAKAACACSARLILGQRDPVGLAFGTGSVHDILPPRSSARHLHQILHKLHHTKANGDQTFVETLNVLVRQLKQRTQILLFTDGFFDLTAFESVMRQMTQRGHQIILFHTLAPEELAFNFDDGIRFECMETSGLHRNVDPAEFADTYLERMQTFLTRLKNICIKSDSAYVPMLTDRPVSETLANYLRTRTGRHTRAAAGSH